MAREGAERESGRGVTVVRFTDGRRVGVVDADCEFRRCFWFGFDKGSFTPGVGYTSYHAQERPVCFTRHLHGCPHKPREEGVAHTYEDGSVMLALLDPLPCCDDPRVPTPRGDRRPLKQRCQSCGAMLTGKRLAYARSEAEPSPSSRAPEGRDA